MSRRGFPNRYIAILFYLLLLHLPVLAQKSKTSPKFFYYNEKGESVKESGAVFMVVVTPNTTTGTYKVDTYNYAGPLFRSEEFKDYEQTIAEGRFVYYGLHNLVDSAGMYKNNLRHGDWYFFEGNGSLKFVKTYENGVLVKTQQPDKGYSTFKLLNEKQSTNIQESYYNPGHKVWINFLNKGIYYPARARKLKTIGNVIVFFIINEEGIINDFFLLRSIEYSLDAVILKLFESTPQWVPAYKDGQPVKSFRKQPITL